VTVALLPPLTISRGTWDGVSLPLYEAPRYVRGPGMSRWHRPRSGVWRPRGAALSFWCGYGYVRGDSLLTAESIPEPEPACGTCEGRALGAGQDDTPAGMPRLAFEPRWLTPPPTCPGSGRRGADRGLIEDLRRNVGRCLVCGALVGIRAMGGPYNPSAGAVSHRPDGGLYEPCPWHAWNMPALRAPGVVGCACGWPVRP
jgi:hypothetical protein